MSLLVPLSNLSQFDSIIDARTPTEFAYDHLPHAINLPVLSNEERHEVGTLYKQSPFLGRQRGATLIARNIAQHIESTLSTYPSSWRPLIYCWRGGKRSGAFAHILRQIGWSSGQLQGGYKSYRREVIQTLETLPAQCRFVVIGGPTGSRKTQLLNTLATQGAQVFDLESLAEHKGSLLGGHPEHPQPSQPQFENRLSQALSNMNLERVIFVESESRRIGSCHLPTTLITAIRASRMILLDSPLSSRVSYILDDYQSILSHPRELMNKILALQPFHSQSQMTTWQIMAENQDWSALAKSLMANHYDPIYQKSLAKNYTLQPDKKFVVNSPEDLPHIAKQLILDWDS